MVNILNRLNKIKKALIGRPSDLIDVTEEFNAAMREVYGSEHCFDRLLVDQDFLNMLELTYGKGQNAMEQDNDIDP